MNNIIVLNRERTRRGLELPRWQVVTIMGIDVRIRVPRERVTLASLETALVASLEAGQGDDNDSGPRSA